MNFQFFLRRMSPSDCQGFSAQTVFLLWCGRNQEGEEEGGEGQHRSGHENDDREDYKSRTVSSWIPKPPLAFAIDRGWGKRTYTHG
jgi:hypothetical protein